MPGRSVEGARHRAGDAGADAVGAGDGGGHRVGAGGGEEVGQGGGGGAGRGGGGAGQGGRGRAGADGVLAVAVIAAKVHGDCPTLSWEKWTLEIGASLDPPFSLPRDRQTEPRQEEEGSKGQSGKCYHAVVCTLELTTIFRASGQGPKKKN